MPTGTWNTTDVDDYSGPPGGGGGHTLDFGHLRIISGAESTRWGTYIRFLISGASAPPPGSTVTSATLRAKGINTTDDNPWFDLFFHDVDDATGPLFNEDVYERERTTAGLEVRRGEVGTLTQQFDVTTLVQEVVNREGWSSGNYMGALLLGVTDTVARSWYIATGNSATPPSLTATWQDTADPLPVAIAGVDQSVSTGDLVVVSGAASTSATEAGITSWLWELVDNDNTGLSDTQFVGANTSLLSFEFPPVGGTVTLRLTVTDDNGSDTDLVSITGVGIGGTETFIFRHTVTDPLGRTAFDDIVVTYDPAYEPPVIAPIVTTHPVNVTVAENVRATFTVGITGTLPVTYQWQRDTAGNGTFINITNATSASYTTPNLLAAQNGQQYRVIITNSGGSATSNAATVTVTTAPVTNSVLPSVSSILTAGTQTTASAGTWANQTTLTYQWQVEEEV